MISRHYIELASRFDSGGTFVPGDRESKFSPPFCWEDWLTHRPRSVHEVLIQCWDDEHYYNPNRQGERNLAARVLWLLNHGFIKHSGKGSRVNQ